MNAEIEAVGDLVSGILTGRAVEGTAGEGRAASGNCLNCGEGLLGKHCHTCGQSGHVHRTLGAFWHDFLHGVFHFEGKIWHTLPMLVWQPGKLTRRYIDGERARFVSPLALFLFMMFAMFAVVSATAGHLDELAELQTKPKLIGQVRTELIAEKVKATELVRDLAAKRATLVAAHQDTSDIDDDLNDAKSDLREAVSGIQEIAKLPASQPQYDDTSFNGWTSGIPFIDGNIAKVQKNPALFYYKLQNAAYKYAWALIPLSLPFVWMIFAWKRQYKLYDHAVFITYSLCFMSMLVIVLILLGKAGAPAGLIVITSMLLPLLHMHRQLRGTYSLGRTNALVRTSVLVWVSMSVLMAFVMLLIVLGVMG